MAQRARWIPLSGNRQEGCPEPRNLFFAQDHIGRSDVLLEMRDGGRSRYRVDERAPRKHPGQRYLGRGSSYLRGDIEEGVDQLQVRVDVLF